MTCKKLKVYAFTLKHNKGFRVVQVASTSLKEGIKQVCNIEGCPRCAIIKYRKIKALNLF